MQKLIKGCRVLDPGQMDQEKDILIKDGVIEAILDPGTDLSGTDKDMEIVDCSGKVMVPGLVDIHVHLREPGHEYKETIETGLKSAAKGGFTAVCSMPNTRPINDNAQVTSFIIEKGRAANGAKVYPAGAISKASSGESLAEIHDMKVAGAKAITDDGWPVSDSQLMRRALEYSKGMGLPVFVHAEDASLAKGGAMNEGLAATQMGIKGIPNAAESVMVARDIYLSELTGAPVHFCHISTAESIEAIRQAKKRGSLVTCETAPHYFTLTDGDIPPYDTNFKMNPPLRSEVDRQAVIQGLVDGPIDAIATDHAPHGVDEKDVEFDQAAFGIIGLETAFALSYQLVLDGKLSLEALMVKMSQAPAGILQIDTGIAVGKPADLTILDLESKWTVNPDDFVSKSRNTPFAGRRVTGEVAMTLVDGKIVYRKS
ncbi:MAG: dihydroorotase [Desulfobacterales bacterium]|nr:dihydroorotase [Desulfobacterales bacterium]